MTTLTDQHSPAQPQARPRSGWWIDDWRPDDPGYTPDEEDEARRMGMVALARIG